MKEKKTEKDLSIIDSSETDSEEKAAKSSNFEPVDASLNPDETIEEVKEKKKIKPWILITSAVLILVIIAVGVFSWYRYTTLATYDGGRVTRAEFNKFYKSTLLSEGITESDLSDVQYVKNNLIVALANEEIIYKQLETLNVGQLTDEELEAIEQDSKELLDNYVEQNVNTIIATLEEGYSDRDLQKAKDKFAEDALNRLGCFDLQDFIDYRVKEEIFTTAYYELLPNVEVAPTEEEVQAEYESMIIEQIVAYDGNPLAYLNEAGSLNYSLYVPEGIRMVRHVLIKLSDEVITEISALKAEDKADEAQALYEESLAEIKPLAEEVLAKLDAGEITFTDAITEYGEDIGMTYYPEGYELCIGYDMYVPEFTEAGLALENIGDYSGLVSTSYGYHIIEYYSDMPSEITPLADIYDNLHNAMLEANRSNRWLEYLNTWPQELNLKFLDEALNEIDLY